MNKKEIEAFKKIIRFFYYLKIKKQYKDLEIGVDSEINGYFQLFNFNKLKMMKCGIFIPNQQPEKMMYFLV